MCIFNVCTYRHGYKMFCRLYLNGFDSGLGTHISPYFVLMRGESDVLLKWPFEHKVTFKLLGTLNLVVFIHM